MRLTRNPQLRYRGDDPIPEGPAFTSYVGWDQLGCSCLHQPEQPAPKHAESSWQQGLSAQWQDDNFNYYQ